MLRAFLTISAWRIFRIIYLYACGGDVLQSREYFLVAAIEWPVWAIAFSGFHWPSETGGRGCVDLLLRSPKGNAGFARRRVAMRPRVAV